MNTQRPPKKSDKIEARLPYAIKRAFLARCEADGRSASEVLRRFIEDYSAATAISLAEARPTMKKTILMHAAGAALLMTGAVLVHARPAAASDTAAVFAALDRDGDGGLSWAEMAAAHPAGASHHPPAALARLHGGAAHGMHAAMTRHGQGSDHFAALDLWGEFAGRDANRDGKLDLAEFRVLHTAMVGKVFRRIDADGNGAIDAAEIGRIAPNHSGFGDHDRNHDGRIDAQEFAAAHGEVQPG